jgi:hypothetical protein
MTFAGARQDAWWSLPGPARLLRRVATDLAAAETGVLGLAFPVPKPVHWLEALIDCLNDQVAATPVVIDVSAGLRGRSPVRMLAAQAGLETSGLRLISQFIDEPSLIDSVFVVHGVQPADWRQWSVFLRGFCAERRRKQSLSAPAIVLIVPPGMPADDVRASLGAQPVRWLGAMSRIDTMLYVERVAGHPGNDLISRVALDTMVEFAGWDREMARALAGLSVEQQLDPVPLLQIHANALRCPPCWENALVDHWDGYPHVSTSALVAAGDADALRVRLWNARVRSLFPFINTVRLAFIAKYRKSLEAALPITKQFNDRLRTYARAFELELYDIRHILGDLVPEIERRLLSDCHSLRTAMAHADPGDTQRIIRVSRAWDRIEEHFPAVSNGWEWPRSGQKQVLLAEPSGAGKSTYVAENFDPVADIVSSDAIFG